MNIIMFSILLKGGMLMKLLVLFYQNVLKKNNVLILQFDKYGILVEKKILKKEDKKDIKFSKKNTENQL